ncbi:XdhC family protein [Curvivirga aplysinae]|uniref:XdhC family protein n=1 Tax=Curvivirga aplysinae TaxID=2529852 RepID=UPI0012BB5CC3|nr:XdhC family protein [Curvivirga aplysinae]MTI09273.1 XdhC family protein [Curvivirga aplysinae]
MTGETCTVQQIHSKNELLLKAEEWLQEGKKVAIATVVQTWGSSPRPVGSQLIVNEDAQFEGSVSGGCIETSVVTEALDIMDGADPQIMEFGVSDAMAWEVGLACGGTVKVYVENINQQVLPAFHRIIEAQKDGEAIVCLTNLHTGSSVAYELNDELPETYLQLSDNVDKAIRMDRGHLVTLEDGTEIFINPYNPPMRMYITGAVHISQALAPMAKATGYDVTLIDHRTAWATEERFPNIKIDQRWADEVLDEANLNHRCAVITLTHDPKLDDPALISALKSKAFYIGALGSKKTHAARVERLENQGFNQEEISRIDAPIGLDIGASSPAEIAIAILGQVTLSLRGSKGNK